MWWGGGGWGGGSICVMNGDQVSISLIAVVRTGCSVDIGRPQAIPSGDFDY